MTEPDKEYWTLDDIAAYLGESVRYIRELEEHKELPPPVKSRVPHQWHRDDVKQWLEDHRGRAH